MQREEPDMADYTAARTMMVDCQVRPSDVTRYPIIEAMLNVPRELYVPSAMKSVAYAGNHIDLEDGRVVLDPRVFAKILDGVALSGGDLVLDLGCGLGYSTAVIAQVAEAVIAIEPDEAMAADAAATLAAQGVDNAVVTAGPLTEGDAAHGPFDLILIGGGVEQIPDSLLSQLKPGGRIGAIFVSGPSGRVMIGTRADDGTGPNPARIAWHHAFDATAPVLSGFERAPEFEF